MDKPFSAKPRLRIRVRRDGTGDFSTITEALQSVPYALPAELDIGEGVFTEKLFCDKADVCLCGQGAGRTVIRWADGAYHPHADGRPTGTFRSYTAFFGGERVAVKRLSIENTVGNGATHGQGLAVYADARHFSLENVWLSACQDTLFCAPLPMREREAGGFRGPRMLTPRLPTRQYYRDCRITGDIDFIFGGADAVFERCQLISRDQGQAVNGYVAAPSGPADGLGFVFLDCAFTSAAAPGTVYLARPWRENGRVVLLRCALGRHIHPAGWSAWVPGTREEHAYFAEFAGTGEGAQSAGRAAWAHLLSPQEAAAWQAAAETLRSEFTV